MTAPRGSIARPVWVLQQNRRDQALLRRLELELDHLEAPWIEVTVVDGTPPALPAAALDGPLICHGASFVPMVARTGWSPGIFFDETLFTWSRMNQHWGELMLSTDEQVFTLAEALTCMDEGGERFVRPDADDKSFDGAVFDVDGLRAVTARIPRDTRVVTATPVELIAEWRCFVVDGQVVAASEYRRAGLVSLHRDAPPAAVELVERAAARWVPAPVVCIDVARTADRFGVIEANCFAAARFYAADLPAVLAAVDAFVAARYAR